MSDDVSLRDYIEARIAGVLSWAEAEIHAIRATMAKSDETLTIRLENETARAIEARESRYALRSDIASLQDRLEREVHHLSEDIAAVLKDVADLKAGGQVTNARLALVGTGIILIVAGSTAFIQITL